MRTYHPNGKDARTLAAGKWRIVDARGKVLGRLAAQVAHVLIGKHKPNYTPSVECGDPVIIINARHIRLTGKKLEKKVYRWHTGYPGGLREVSAQKLMETRPEEVVREAVLGMLPKNKLRKRRARKLRIFADEAHTHQAQQPEPLDLQT